MKNPPNPFEAGSSASRLCLITIKAERRGATNSSGSGCCKSNGNGNTNNNNPNNINATTATRVT